MPRLWRARPSRLTRFAHLWRANSQGRGRARHPNRVTVASHALALAMVCAAFVASACVSLVPRSGDRDRDRDRETSNAKTSAHASSGDIDTWLARRYPEASLSPPDDHAPREDEPPHPAAHDLACARGDARACSARPDPGAYVDPRAPVLRRGCFGPWMERAGKLGRENTLNIERIDGGYDGSW